jgi:hypothetical protein
MLPRVEYSVTARAGAEELWRAFCDLTRLLGRGIYSEATWTEGEPWRTGSRLRYLILRPVEATVSAVVTLSEPPTKVGLLNHALGVTAQQMVTFSALSKDCTRVMMVMDFVGESPTMTPERVSEALQFLTQDALETMLSRWQESRQTK